MNFTFKKAKGEYIYKNLDGFDFTIKSKRKLDGNIIDQVFLAVRKSASNNGGWVKGEVDGMYYEYKEPDTWNSKPKKVKPFKKSLVIRIVNVIKKMLK